MKFKVGDKVKVTEQFHEKALVGALAKIVDIEDECWYALDIEGWTGGHDCGVLGGGARSGWWVTVGCFEKASSLKGNK